MVKVGDKVAAEQSLITVEGDKASMEVPAPFAGTVKEIKISTGDKVSTGSLIMVFEVEGARRRSGSGCCSGSCCPGSGG
jgi:pyruvate dehydrogenase E2 component (dihydrolipoamide acetyltransferase)